MVIEQLDIFATSTIEEEDKRPQESHLTPILRRIV